MREREGEREEGERRNMRKLALAAADGKEERMDG